jgi:hypothetical protein
VAYQWDGDASSSKDSIKEKIVLTPPEKEISKSQTNGTNGRDELDTFQGKTRFMT